MKKSTTASSAALLCAMMCCAQPGVDAVPLSFSVVGNERIVKIEYTLTGEPAVVTVDLQTNTLASAGGEWVSIGGEAIGELRGAANKVVRTLGTPVAAYWIPAGRLQGRACSFAALRAVVTAWPTNMPPDYMVVDLTAKNDSVRWYASTNLFPRGFSDPRYKTTHLVMRKIPAKGVIWRMGIVEGDECHEPYDVAHNVLLTYDYYAGIYELTQSQYRLFNVTSPAAFAFADKDDSSVRPAERLGVGALRGQKAKAYCWPGDGHNVSGSSVIGLIRARCGIADMDLPTEAEWEYACRGGSAAALTSGKAYTQENLDEVAWNSNNASHQTHAVGMLAPNAFGLYDTIGNVYELCLDRIAINNDAAIEGYLPLYKATFADGWESGAATTNPPGVSDAGITRYSKRGGSWNYGLNSGMSCGHRSDGAIDYATGDTGTGYIGCRLFCSVEAAVKAAEKGLE